ncbi:MAG: class I SAM-dependent methyltransferase [Hyphomicrobiaceae bacterium]
MNWVDYWNGKPTVYVCHRHQEVHDFEIAYSVARHLPAGNCTALDFGCGDATRAYFVASRCETLYLWDAAEAVRVRLRQRYLDHSNIAVLDPAGLHALEPGSIDLVTVSSVVQYLAPYEIVEALQIFKKLLSPRGSLIVADVIPPSVSVAHDAWQLLRFARSEGFTFAAACGLARTAASDYRSIRTKLNLRKYSELAFLDLLRVHGFAGRRLGRNFGHNQLRMAFQAHVAAPESGDSQRREAEVEFAL